MNRVLPRPDSVALKFILTSMTAIVGFVMVLVVSLAFRKKPSAPAPIEATIYATSLQGRPTKSGIIFDNEAPLAAMKDKSQIGKWKRVRVAGTEGPTIYVLVADLMPMDAKAEIDLSTGSARLLGEHLLRRGRFPVIVEDAK